MILTSCPTKEEITRFVYCQLKVDDPADISAHLDGCEDCLKFAESIPPKPRATEPTTRTVVCQLWEESERGWGARPDGYTLHLTEADRRAFIADYWARQPREVPDEYSRPSGMPTVLDVNDEVYGQVRAGRFGQWYSGNPPKPVA
jgi:hypothetical protein